MTAIAAFGAGMCCGVLCAWLLPKLLHRLKQKPKPPGSPKQREERYGHPSPPISTLRKQLPDPPQNHVWEVKVQHDSDGNACLHLTLVNVLTGTNVSTTNQNLIRGGYPWSTWAAYYRNWGADHRGFNQKIIGPMVDWAAAQANKIDRSNAVGGYSMGDLS